jgi:hypothetical protein
LQNLSGSYFLTAGTKLISEFCEPLPSQEQLIFKRKLTVLFPHTSKLDHQKFIDSIDRFDLNVTIFAPILKRELSRFHPNTRSAFVKFTDHWLRFGRYDALSSGSAELQTGVADKLFHSFLDENHNRSTSRILGIISVAGNGKSVLFARLCHLYSLDLIAVHVCKYSNESTRDPLQFVKSIMAQLVKNLAPFGEALGVVQESTFKDKTAKDLWNEVIVTPLKRCAEELAYSQRRRFIAIDALDGVCVCVFVCVRA